MFVCCPECGAGLTAAEIDLDAHECRLDLLIEFQTAKARVELEQRLEAPVAVWEREPRLAAHAAFARFLRERPASAGRGRLGALH